MTLKLGKLLHDALADIVSPKRARREIKVVYDPIGGASGITHTLSATGHYEDIIPGGHKTWPIDDLAGLPPRMRGLAHHHLTWMDVFHKLWRQPVNWYTDHFLARDVRIREIGNGKHYAHRSLVVPMGRSRRLAVRQACEELDRIAGKKLLLYVEGGPTATCRKL